MDVEAIAQLRREIDVWTLNLRDATRVLRNLKERAVRDCDLGPDEISRLESFGDDPIGLKNALMGYVEVFLDQLEGG